MIGQRFLHYQIVDKLGEGGMGIVYKARDTKLDRYVALKFLPHDIRSHEMEQARFIQEAKAASALSHPNVCVIHAIEEHQGQLCIVMECIEGKTLRQRLLDGPLKLSEVVAFAVQIGEALREAHANGVVHRDIKSDNIMVTPRGQIKVMDFGLAKLKGSVKLTRTSSTVGTLAYMAPEQIQGGDVEPRTDLFSFGVALYEMLTGRLPFRAESDAGTMYAILNEPPEPARTYRPDLPAEFVHVLDRALEKDREDRYQSANDMLIELRRLERDSKRVVRPTPESASPTPAGQAAAPAPAIALATPVRRIKRAGWVIPAVAAAGLVAIVAVAIVVMPKPAPPPTHRQLTFTGRATTPAVSPDGSSVAFVEELPDADDRLMVQDLAGGQPLEIFRFPTLSNLRWSPSGSELMVFGSSDTVYRAFLVPRLGGQVRRMGSAPYRTFSPDGSLMAAVGGGGAGRQIRIARPGERAIDSLTVSGNFIWLFDLDWSPRRDVFAFLTRDSSGSSIRTIRRSDHRLVQTYHDSVEMDCPRWAPRRDAIYFVRQNRSTVDLMRLDVGRDGQTRRGPPRTLLTGLDLGSYFAVSKDGKRLVCTRVARSSNIHLATLKTGAGAREVETRQLTHGTSQVGDVSFSPDGSRLALSMGSGDRTNIYTLDLAAGAENQVTFLDQLCSAPVWSPDGAWIAFAAGPSTTPSLYVTASSGGGTRRFAGAHLSETPMLGWSPGSDILYLRPGNRNFSVANPGTEKERPLAAVDSLGWMFSPAYSADGRQVAVWWNRKDGDRGIWRLSAADTAQVLVTGSYAYPLAWSADGRWIYAAQQTRTGQGRTLVRCSIASGRVEPFVTLPFERISALSLTPDGKRIACVVPETKSDVWWVENFDPAAK